MPSTYHCGTLSKMHAQENSKQCAVQCKILKNDYNWMTFKKSISMGLIIITFDRHYQCI